MLVFPLWWPSHSFTQKKKTDLAFELIDNEISSRDQLIQSGGLIVDHLMPQLELIVFIMQRANSSEGEWFEGPPRVEPRVERPHDTESHDQQFFMSDWLLVFRFLIVFDFSGLEHQAAQLDSKRLIVVFHNMFFN